tara:strand:- start:626 stop:892 length:267 start_codon:yes stop_codon:yes gene_type:complete
MGKWKATDVEDLKKEGLLSKKAVAEIEKKNLVSKPKAVKRYMKTADGKWVEPRTYFRGGKNTKLSKRQKEYINKVNKLIESYTTTKQK